MATMVPAGEADQGFLFEVYAATRREEVASWGWPDQEQDRFLRMQFQVRDRAYSQQYPGLERSVVLVGPRRVGAALLARSAREIHLVDIALLPEFRGRGIGTAVLQALQREAEGTGRTLSLCVEKGNHPARLLYERLGFARTGETATHLAMAWRPSELPAR